MIDLHCHVLPGIDDGPPDLDAALALARALVADGVTLAVATPHVFPGRYDNTAASIALAHAAFQKALEQAAVPLQLRCAGEVRLGSEVLDGLRSGALPFLCAADLPGPRPLLLEMPDGQVPLGTERLCALLVREGVLPVIAHPERNRGIMDRFERVLPLLDAGCVLQLTAGSLLGEFGNRACDTAWALLDGGGVVAVASDAHNLRGRAPRMGAARALLTRHGGAALAQRLLHDGPARLCGLQPVAVRAA